MPIITDLIIDQYGAFVSKHQGRLRVTQQERTLAEAPIMHLQRVVITGRGVSLSSDVIAACCQEGIPIHFLDSRGQPYAGLCCCIHIDPFEGTERPTSWRWRPCPLALHPHRPVRGY